MRKCYEIVSKSAKVSDQQYGVYLRYKGITKKFPLTKEQYEDIDLKTSVVTLSRNKSGRVCIDRVFNKRLESF